MENNHLYCFYSLNSCVVYCVHVSFTPIRKTLAYILKLSSVLRTQSDSLFPRRNFEECVIKDPLSLIDPLSRVVNLIFDS